VPERLFTLDEAQALLDDQVRALAERMVDLRTELRPLEKRWQKLVITVGSNGGGLAADEANDMRERLEEGHEELRGLLQEIADLGVQVKDPDSGLLDFPSEVDGEAALLCWRVGEPRIAFWHSPEDGFAGRRPL
jgi:hypothetical protein